MKNYSIVHLSYISGRAEIVDSFDRFSDAYHAFINLLNNTPTMLSDVRIDGIHSSFRYYIGGELYSRIYIKRNNN